MQTPVRKISVKKGRDWQLRRGHPWLFSGAISQAPSGTAPGDIVDLVDIDGKFIARGYYNPACDIAVRVLTLDASEEITDAFLEERVRAAIKLRDLVFDPLETNVYRLINAEGDFLPGFIVDVFNEIAVVQSHTAGSDRLLPQLLEALKKCLVPKAIVVRNDASVRKREGLSLESPQLVHGQLPVDQPIQVRENSLSFCVDILKGQKTGFFTDQRDKRLMLRGYAARMPVDSVMANCFSYSGSFSIYAVANNPTLHTVDIDQSEAALELAKQNFEVNKFSREKAQFVVEDAFAWLERQISEERKFDIVILDPPAFAKTQKDKESALKAYSRLNQLGMRVCQPGGLLFTCSCSGVVSAQEFEDCIRDAVGRTGRRMQLLESHKNGFDHPINMMASESQYLKAVLCRVF